MYLVDDGGGDSSVSDPPYTPSDSPGSSSPSHRPGGDDKNDGDKNDKDEGASSGLGGLPLAAQAGISLGVILLAGLALIPGRRPPATLRG